VFFPAEPGFASRHAAVRTELDELKYPGLLLGSANDYVLCPGLEVDLRS
jgi:hypothetical protein